MPSVKLDDKDVQLIYYLCDIGLKSGGIGAFTAIRKLLDKLPNKDEKPEEEEEVSDDP